MKEPKNKFGESLFPITIGEVLRWARSRRSAIMLRAIPRYHPQWAH